MSGVAVPLPSSPAMDAGDRKGAVVLRLLLDPGTSILIRMLLLKETDRFLLAPPDGGLLEGELFKDDFPGDA